MTDEAGDNVVDLRTEKAPEPKEAPKPLYVPAPEGYRCANVVFKTGHNWPVEGEPVEIQEIIDKFLMDKDEAWSEDGKLTLKSRAGWLALKDAKWGEPIFFLRNTLAENLMAVGVIWLKERPAVTPQNTKAGSGVEYIWVAGEGYKAVTMPEPK